MFSKKWSWFLLIVVSCGHGFCEFKNSTGVVLKRAPKFLQENCQCPSPFQCECCANVNNDMFNIHQKLCADWLVFSETWNIRANVRLNDNVMYTNTFSAFNVPPFCAPLWPAFGISGCFQVHSIGQHEFNTLHACGNMTLNFITITVLNWSVGCLDVGTGGIQSVEPNHDGLISTTTEKPPEISLETSDR